MKAWMCGTCGSLEPEATAKCAACGGTSIYGVAAGAVVSLPQGFACPACGRDDETLIFRGWVRHTAFVIGSRELRGASYLCPPCQNRAVATALAWTGICGWWSLPSFFVRAPRATFYNWLAAFRPPIRPLAWGAVPVEELLNGIRGERDAYEHATAQPGVDYEDSPFAALSEQQAAMVFSAVALYETLHTSMDASHAELRKAYAARAREVHPDMRPGRRDTRTTR